MSTKVKVNLNTEELVGILDHLVSNNRHLQSGGKRPIAMAVEGDAGIGKTSVIVQYAQDKGLDCVKLNLSQIEEIGDLVGFPVKEYEVINLKNEEGNQVKWVPESAIELYAKEGYNPSGEKRMKHAPPDWIQGKTEGGILILDDYTRADQRFLQACMELIDRQEYISWKLPKDWHIILTTNPDDGSYLVNSIDDAQKTRFFTVDLKYDVKCWAKWAENAGIDGRCINFLLLHPELIDGADKKINARSVTTFFNGISSLPNFEDHLPLIALMGEGSVGPEFSKLFTLFINNNLDKLVPPHEILFGKGWKSVKEKILDCTGEGAKYRADIGSLLVTRVINYALHYAKDNPISNDAVERILEIYKDDDVFTTDLKYYVMKAIANGNKVKFQKLFLKPEIAHIILK